MLAEAPGATPGIGAGRVLAKALDWVAQPSFRSDMNAAAPREAKKRGCGCLASAAGLAVAGLIVLIWLFPNCDASSSQAKMARGLPPERLAELYRTMGELYGALPEDEKKYQQTLFGEKVPKEFEGLKCDVVRVGGNYPGILRLEGCFDHYLDMKFYGIGEASTGDNSPRITLQSGEFEILEEELWRPAKPAGELVPGGGGEQR